MRIWLFFEHKTILQHVLWDILLRISIVLDNEALENLIPV